MTKTEIVEQLEVLRKDLKDYAEYLENYTYSPYDEVNKFAHRVDDLIAEIKEAL